MLKEAKYERMRKDILARILSGQFPEKKLPPMPKLAEEYNVSLMTANRAVKLLEEAGVVQCRAGNVGTVIDEKQAVMNYSRIDSHHIWTDINAYVQKEITVRFLCNSHFAGDSEIWDETISGFKEEYPWIEPEIVGSDSIGTDLQETSEYDIIHMFGRDVKCYLAHDRVMNITPLFDMSRDLNRADFLPHVLDHCSVDGKLHALPMHVSVPVVFYNRKYFKNPSELSGGWTAFLNCVKNAVERGEYSAIQLGLVSLVHYFFGSSHRLLEDNIDEDSLLDLLKILKYINLAAPSDLALEAENVKKAFQDGQIKFLCAYSFFFSTFSSDGNFDPGVMPMPQTAAGRPVFETGVNAINPHSNHKKEAWLFIKYLCSANTQKIFARNRKYIPVNLTAFNNDYSDQNPGDAKVIMDILSAAVPSTVSSQELYTLYRRIHPVLEKFYLNKIDLETAAARFLERAREMLVLEDL